MDIHKAGQAALQRRRAALDEATANIRADLAEYPGSEMELLATIIAANLAGPPLVSAGVGSLAMVELAKAQGEIIRIQAELDGERAAHSQCHRNMLRAAQGRDPE